MPVIITSDDQHPFLPSRGDITAIDLYRAQHQDIRPMQILMLNLMADKIGTERQIARCLGDTEIQVQITFAATDDYINSLLNGRESVNTPTDHITRFYSRFSDVRHQKFDGLIVTGINAREPDLTKEPMWPEIKDILEWSKTNVTSSLFLCWGGHAALKYFHDIDRVKQPQKTWGVYIHAAHEDRTGLLNGLPDAFPIPVSRWNEIRREDILATSSLELTAWSDEAGVGIVTDPEAYDDGQRYFARRLYVFNHPEYDTETLANEYRRDANGQTDARQPAHYFLHGNPATAPSNTWRHTGRIYAHWVRQLYAATPYDLAEIPTPYRRERLAAQPLSKARL